MENRKEGLTTAIVPVWLDPELEDLTEERKVTTAWLVSEILKEKKWKRLTKNRMWEAISSAYYLGRRNEKHKDEIPKNASLFSLMQKISCKPVNLKLKVGRKKRSGR